MAEEYIIGRNTVIEALKSTRNVYKIWIAENSVKGQAQQIAQLAKEKGIIIQTVPKKKLIRWQKGTIRELSHRWLPMNMPKSTIS